MVSSDVCSIFSMVISRDKNTKANVIVDNVALEQVKEFKYLGQIITADAKTETEIRIRKVLSNKRISQKHTAQILLHYVSIYL